MLWGYAGVWPGEFGIYKNENRSMAILEFLVANGFQSGSLRLADLKEDPAKRDAIATYVADHDLQITLHPPGGYFKEEVDTVLRRQDEFLEDLRTYGELLRTPIVTTGAGPVHRFMADPSLAQQMDRLTQCLTPLAAGCHELGRPLGIENHGDYYCQDLVELCQRVPHLNIFLDTGNTYLIGEQSVPACRLAAPYTIGTHFKDHVVHPDPKTLTFVIKGASLGDGHVGLRQVYHDLVELAPNPEKLVMHWELVPPKDMDPWDSLERSWQFIRSLDKDA